MERCADCTGRRVAFRTARAAVEYDAVVRRIVGAWKERGLRPLGETVAELVVAAVSRPDVDAITYIPADRDRTLWRGTHTARALAEALASRWDLPLAVTLRRARRVERQRGLSRAARRTNVRGAFRAEGQLPRRLLLVDDVYTTGSTVGAAATELRRAGARRIDVVTFARAVRN